VKPPDPAGDRTPLLRSATCPAEGWQWGLVRRPGPPKLGDGGELRADGIERPAWITTVEVMITVQRVVTTALDPQATFNYLSAFEHTPDWDPGIPVVEKQTAGPIAVGTKYHAVAEFRGKRQPIDYVVAELSEDRIQLRGENKTVISIDTISVRPAKSGAEVTYRAEFTLKGLAKLATPIMAPMLEKLGDPAADGMKQKLDSLAAAPAAD